VIETAAEAAAQKGRGSVLVNASRPRGIFLLDGKKVSSKAPFQLDDLDASAEHVLEASLVAGGATVRQRFHVIPDQVVTVNVHLDETDDSADTGPTGSIRVETEQRCTVTIDGKRAGVSPLKVRVPVGVHRVLLEPANGGEARTIEVKVNEHKVAVISARF
jgi:hypothetical protein